MRTFNQNEVAPTQIIEHTDSNEETVEVLNELSSVDLLFSDQDHSDIFSFSTELPPQQRCTSPEKLLKTWFMTM